jgi:ParB-like chromosome segregation protein Spo0J
MIKTTKVPFSLQQISHADIDARDLSFVVSYGFDLAGLRDSVQELGLLAPPLLRVRPDGRYQIICGYQRILVLAQLGWHELPALLVPEETPAAWCLQASLADNLLGRGLNPMETALMVERLVLHHPEEMVRRTYLPLLGLPPSRQQLQKMRALMDLESPWQELVARSRLSLEAAAVLGQWPAADREAIWPWFQTLVLSYSKQLEILECLNTLNRRTDEAPAAWLRRPELAEVLADPSLSSADKGKRLRERLREWCFPRISQAQERFQHILKALKLYQHPDMRLTVAPAFEETVYRLELRFQDKARLASQLEQVRRLLDQPEFEDLLEL